MDGLLDMFVRKSAITNTMQQVISITEPIINRGPSIEEQQAQIQENQFKYLLVLLSHFAVALLMIGLLTFFKFSEQIQQIPFIIWVVLLMLYLLSIAIVQFSESSSQKQPKNVFLFGVNTLVRLFWFIYAVVLYPQLHLEVVIGLLLINLLVILLCFHLDKSEGIKNCFLVCDQPWRISFVLLFEILFVGLYLNIQDAATAIIWILVLFALYTFILLNVQLVEFRRHLAKNGNVYLLSQMYFDGDIVFPCYFLQHHLLCTSERSILRQ
ncbi:unnamed protein product (macronuclear) [Paramecium tetraurelia]|uniref:Transmembrane protein n=1 Tax=Paramecium tetraurelia TaxID=5888 RepID=A0CNB6_PARTE|nr:uncharacterized protein GSPATT00008725001 [Paramecium tetraurelia]CAK72283.1 unnamed protein product [Paramecium tetraurelia]|eukprot:XP_001439680.1 hypothetical protein (macronuclear) [Paramecium tetraurelia strain d4-2]